MALNRIFRVAALFLVLILTSTGAYATTDKLQLPSLGEASAGLLSPDDEYELGQMILRYYRASFPTSDDPFFEDYLGRLLQKIAHHSDLTDKRLELLVIDSPSLNAFAAPGGIVGVNIGTFLSASSEQQLASILAHELAHLSQRHYARRLQNAKTTNLVSVAALLAGILVASTSGSDGAIAALPAIQAGAIESSLRFSRQMEKEADRLGMATLVRADFDPYAMPEMFEAMLKTARFRSKVPEFLLTHPVTESRIADSMGRASKYPRKHNVMDMEYQLLRARSIHRYEGNAQASVKRFRAELAGNNMPADAARYGLVMALTETGQLEQAKKELARLQDSVRDTAILAIAEANLLAKQRQFPEALAGLKESLQHQPNHHPLNVRYAELLMEAGNYPECEAVLKQHVKRRPKNSYVWYLLAEVHGLTGNILDVHKARAEYFMLLGIYDKAEIQLRNALQLLKKEDFQGRARIEQRLLEVKKLRENQPT